jgi:tetrapyrrole methylase family protein/MazG family protein
VPTVVAVGLGPAGADLMTTAALETVSRATTARLRTRRHPAATAFPGVESFDQLYEAAPDFESLYQSIADELVRLATTDPRGTVVYAVPGSPSVAERTVAILGDRDDLDLVIVPGLSFVDLACATLCIDPIAVGLRLGDALELPDRLGGRGPLLLAQAHSRDVLADVALRVDDDLESSEATAVVLHHLGLPDERVERRSIGELASFRDPDHLTSVYLEGLRGPGDAVDDLVELMDVLRERCPWDRVQTHTSLGRYLLEESYEALDALETLAAALDDEAAHGATPDSAGLVRAAGHHAEEELGDVLFQLVFHARLGIDEGLFDLRSVADAVRHKLVGRHPHVFADAVATTPDAVAARWEALKRDEKGRDSVMDGIPDALPALSLMAKVRRKSLAAGLEMRDAPALLDAARDALSRLPLEPGMTDDATIGADRESTEAIGVALEAVCDLARLVGVDPEQALRDRARAAAALVRAHELRYRAARDEAGSVAASEARRSEGE